MTEKGPLKTLIKILQKSTENMKISTIFGRFQSLNNSSYQKSEATFQQAIFSLAFILVLVKRPLEV